MLTHWGRDRKRGPGLPLEYMVKRQTSETADFFGFHDRGRLQPGKRADIKLYPDAGHGFGNPNNKNGYRAADAADAWQRTVKFLNETLKKS